MNIAQVQKVPKNNYNEKSDSLFSLVPSHPETVTPFSYSFQWESKYLQAYPYIFFPTKIVDLCTLFCMCFFTEQSILEIFTSALIQLPPFNGYIIFHCTDVPQIIWWTFSCFQLFAIKNNDATTIDNGWGRGCWVSPISGFPFFHTREFYKGHISQPPLQLGVATWLNSGHGCKQMHMWQF